MLILQKLVVCSFLAQGALVAQTQSPAQERVPAKAPPPARLQRGREFLGLGPEADAAAAARGQKVYAQNCSFCHGAEAKGGEGPDLVRSSVVLHDEHGETIGQVVTKGRPERGMPAFPNLSPEQVSDVAQFLHSRVEAAANRYGYKLLNVVTGDAAAGKVFFDAHCSNCHSPEKDLAHIASRFEPQDLQSQFLYPASGKVASAPPQVTVVLPSGESISGKLKTMDDFTVSLWDTTGQYRSFGRQGLKVHVEDPLAGHRELLNQYTNKDMHDVLAYLVTLK